MLHRIRLMVIIGLLLIMLMPAVVAAEEAVVYGVFFYSPTCPHCHEVIDNHWPGIQAEFGDQLRVLFIDASGARGNALMQAAREALNIESNGVPMLIIGRQVMVGSVDIPARAPVVIRAGLAAGGIELPPVPGLQEIYQAAVKQYESEQAEQAAAEPTAPVEAPSLSDRLAADPVANAAAVVVLVLLAASLVVILAAYAYSLVQGDDRWLRWLAVNVGPWMIGLLALMGLGLALSLGAGSLSEVLVLLVAAGEAAAFVGLFVLIWRGRALPEWLIPLAAVAGIVVAAYLAAVEMTLSEAVCGAVGNCNTVQQSQYARVLNIPIGVIGLAGYTGLVAAWAAGRFSRRWLWLRRALLEMCLLGVAFSTYLTFLEPFVIGATCVWCLLSAVWMLVLLWLALAFRVPARAASAAEPGATLASSPAP